MQLASVLLYGKKFPNNLNGTDLVPHILAACPPVVRIYLLGAKLAVVKKAASVLSKYPNVDVCGYRDGYSCWNDMSNLIEEINAVKPDVIFVALGNPSQELWIAAHGSDVVAPVLVGVGALFDFISGAQRRAPLYVRKLRMEWLHRLICEPRRLWRRYTIDIVRFAFIVSLSGLASATGLLRERLSLWFRYDRHRVGEGGAGAEQKSEGGEAGATSV
jgi:beta-1,4-glucosyltransferase